MVSGPRSGPTRFLHSAGNDRFDAVGIERFDYKQLVRQEDVAIYSQSWRGCSEPSLAFDVICVRRHDGKEIKGQSVEPSEFYPSSTDWGKYGFTFIDKEAAFSKLRELSRRTSRSRK